MASTNERLDRIEQALAGLAERLDRLEGATAAPPPAAARPPAARPPAARPTRPAPTLPRVDVEDLLGGRVLAWLGGVAVLIGVVLFVAYAVRIGWIDEPTRVVLAFLASTALLAGGYWLHE